MDIVSCFSLMLQEFAVVMNSNTLKNFSTLACGWIFAPKRTITGMIVAAGMAGVKHHSAFHRIFSAASWSLDEFGFVVLRMIRRWINHEDMVLLAIDDTLARKRGLKIFGVGTDVQSSRSTVAGGGG